MANRLLADRDASPVGKRWAINFIKRQPELKTRFQRKYDYQRAKCEDPTIIRNWFRLTEFFLAFYAAFQLTMTKSNIKGGFRGAGLAPFDPEVVILKLDVQLQTPTPVKEEAQQAQS
ncbi:uncharacterized protein FRV6_00007 [Fusarium oxysporum]|uniref:HTH CENPB-type domain-containing protein n=1 Tax=Fusarium oxysporum TaxID=5507 RepID=A0A2H3SQY3_FUSOX|nr:uncharacterized protein FRV6_00007 [Fusarium oxysporum]